MKYVVNICLGLLFSLSLCAQKKEVRVVELNYGTYTADNSVKRKNLESAVQKSTSSSNFIFDKDTDQIVLRKGAKFGLHFKLESDISGSFPLEIEWKYPKAIEGKDGKKYRFYRGQEMKSSRTDWNIGYIIEDDIEMLAGVWRLRIYYKNKKLYERKFYLNKEGEVIE